MPYYFPTNDICFVIYIYYIEYQNITKIRPNYPKAKNIFSQVVIRSIFGLLLTITHKQ